MKNILIYVNPSKTFFGKETGSFRDCSKLVKIQIDNSLDLGWRKEDILLFTNFDYEYNGIKSMIVDDVNYCPFRPLSTKTITISYLLEKDVLNKNQVYWVHDFDAFQLNRITEKELGMDDSDFGLTDYGWMSKWCMGSIFFKKGARDIFQKIKNKIYEIKNEDERAFRQLTHKNIGNINKRIKKLNITYDFGMRHVEHNYKIAQKPLRVIHFHPDYNLKDTLPASPLECFMYGKNGLKTPLMDNRLIKIFQSHGIK